MSDERLPRGADDDGRDARELAAAGEELEVVLEGLAEADAGIDQDLRAVDAGSPPTLPLSGGKRSHAHQERTPRRGMDRLRAVLRHHHRL
ncbi:MAG TPA: hypothetical protein VHL59_09210, partial [Thermoanaerobaculia bacterium]|nr:hypothetical protein [Thermoanaerobaculia bacterium]